MVDKQPTQEQIKEFWEWCATDEPFEDCEDPEPEDPDDPS